MTDTLEAELDHRYPLGETEPGDQRSAFLAGWVAGINFTRQHFRPLPERDSLGRTWFYYWITGIIAGLAIGMVAGGALL